MHESRGPLTRDLRKQVAIAAIVVIAVAVVAGFAVRIHRAHVALASQIPASAYTQAVEEAKLAGIPVTAQALQAPLPPAAKNAAPIYTQLTDLLTKHPLSKEGEVAKLAHSQAMPTSQQFKQIRGALEQRTDLMALIHQAAERPECVFIRDWSDPTAIRYKEIATIRTASRLLYSESILFAHDGKPLDAVRNQALGFNLARHVENEDTSIEYLVALAMDTATLHGLQNILYISAGDPTVADAVKSTVESQCRPHSMAKAIKKEAGIDIVTMRVLHGKGPSYLDFDGSSKPSQSITPKPRNWDKFVDEAGLVMLRREMKAMAAADLPYIQSAPLFREIDDEIDKDKDPKHALAALFSGYFSRATLTRLTIVQAIAETTRSAAALLVYKSRHGSFPAALADALTPVPADPFDGKPLRYQREGMGFVVYSVGADRTFAGSEPRTVLGKDDVVFRYPLPDYLTKAVK